MEKSLLKIEIMGTQVTNKNGEKFMAFKAFTKKGKMDIKFVKDVCNIVPTKSCFIYIDENYRDEQGFRAIQIDRKFKYPVLWVRRIEKIEDFADRTQTYDDLFDK